MINLSNTAEEKEAIEWMDKTIEIAKKALCSNAKCGAIIVKNGEVIGEGYNAPPLDGESNRKCSNEYNLPQKFKYDRTCCVHAEQRAIMDALRKNPDKISGSRLYFLRVDDNGNIKKSGKPYCTVCSRLALDAGIKEFVLWHEQGICVYSTDEYNDLSYQYTED
ncbi:MAG: deaminase [Candidatus Pacebacteria bacterium]|nr:deaminase [Candidatus Paceibacterota bacterium]